MQHGDQSERRRVLVPQALGSNGFLRATWHRAKGTVVVSQWDGAECVAAIPVRVSDLDELTHLLTDATTDSASIRLAWPAPDRAALVVPAQGLTVPCRERSA